MECECDKNSILFRGDNGSFFQLYRLPIGNIRTAGFGNLDLNPALVQNLREWLDAAIKPPNPFTFQGAGGSTSPGKGKGAGILRPAADAARGGGA